MMRTTYHVCGFFLPEGAWGKPIFMANPTTGKVTHTFYPEKVAEYEDLEEGFEPPQRPMRRMRAGLFGFHCSCGWAVVKKAPRGGAHGLHQKPIV